MNSKVIYSSFLIWLILSTSAICHSQDTITIYYNLQKEKTTKDNAVFYRNIIVNEDSTYDVLEYNMQGYIQMEGTYKSNRLKTKHGYFRYYFETGSIESEGNYLNNRHNGDWIFYFHSGKKSAKDTYKNGLRLKTVFWDEDGAEVPPKEAEYPPQYPGGWEAYGKFLTENIKYPTECIENGIQGKVIVQIDVNQQGRIVDSHVVNSVHPLLDKEALRVINLVEYIMPGKEHNRFLKTFNIPVRFTLSF